MRGRHSWGVAVRRASGEIVRESHPLPPPGSRNKILRFPVIRGVVALYESLSLGVKALQISANIGLEDQLATEGASAAEDASAVGGAEPAATTTAGETAPKVKAVPKAKAAPKTKDDQGKGLLGKKEMGATLFFSLVVVVGLFIVVPLVAAKAMGDLLSNPILFNLFEGVIRLILFIGYLLAVQLFPDLRRVWEYHGAEHKLIHAYEACGHPDPVYAQKFSTRHPRCGTGFLLLVFVLAVFLFALVGRPPLVWLVLSRIIGIPIIIGIGYEVGIKWAGRSQRLWARILLWPGIQLQRLTTREPSFDQLEVAASALEEVIAMDEAEVSAQNSQKEALALS